MKMKLIAALVLASAMLVSGPAFASGSRGGGGGGHASGGFRGGDGGFSSAFRGGSSRAFSGGRSFRSSGFAFGGSSLNSRSYYNRRGGNSGYTYGSSSRGGYRGRDRYWNGRYYRWYNNGWVIDPYGYYGDYPYDSGYYDNDAPDYTEYGSSDDASSSMSDGSTSNASLSVPAQVQQELARDRYYQGPIDGILGPATQAAIAAYQRDNGLRVTGTINSHLLDALDLD